MNIKIARNMLVALGCALVGAAQALTFDSISVSGNGVEAGWSKVVGDKYIDFQFPNAVVGDPVAPVRFGSIIITFNVKANQPIKLSKVNYFILGALAGSGQIQYNEVIEDLANPTNGQIGAANVNLTSNSDLPATGTIVLRKQSDWVRVKKTVVMQAPDTAALDFAALALVEQTFECVPEPGTYAALALGLGLIAARRRNK